MINRNGKHNRNPLISIGFVFISCPQTNPES